MHRIADYLVDHLAEIAAPSRSGDFTCRAHH